MTALPVSELIASADPRPSSAGSGRVVALPKPRAAATDRAPVVEYLALGVPLPAEQPDVTALLLGHLAFG